MFCKTAPDGELPRPVVTTYLYALLVSISGFQYVPQSPAINRTGTRRYSTLDATETFNQPHQSFTQLCVACNAKIASLRAVNGFLGI
ncbi:MAG: hypothetical protein K2X93_20655 [Candidatus Obscuribacterales bacterium]|nr:hypothetical protein [Candidatus Obscuribacterales bacterium]